MKVNIVRGSCRALPKPLANGFNEPIITSNLELFASLANSLMDFLASSNASPMILELRPNLPIAPAAELIKSPVSPI